MLRTAQVPTTANSYVERVVMVELRTCAFKRKVELTWSKLSLSVSLLLLKTKRKEPPKRE